MSNACNINENESVPILACQLRLTMNGYKAFYRGKQCEVWADTSFQAQQKASVVFKAKKAYEITVVLCEKQGKQVINSTSNI